MANRRGKSQARRNHGSDGGLPGWAWGMIGLLLGVGLIIAAPRLLKSDDGFFRPQPNPDAQPTPVAVDEDDVPALDDGDAPAAAEKSDAKAAEDTGKQPDYDFYTLLPGKEVPLTDAELAATERAEAQRAAQQKPTAAAQIAAATGALPLPPPVETDGGSVAPPSAPTRIASAATSPASASAAAPAAAVGDDTRYLLQAGAFQASGQAEELKARIALLGLGARVESASLGGKTVYRVRMGPYGTASELAEAKRKLANGGLPGMAIKVK